MDALNDLLPRLEQLNQIGAALSDERDIDRLLENILLAAKAITHADGGSLYRVSEDQKSLHFEIVRTNSLGLALGALAASLHAVDFVICRCFAMMARPIRRSLPPTPFSKRKR